jgi:segregation and condensation protein B
LWLIRFVPEEPALSDEETTDEDPLVEVAAEDISSGDEEVEDEFAEEDDEADDFSLDDLGAAYARAMVQSGMLPAAEESEEDAEAGEEEEEDEQQEAVVDEDDAGGISPLSIVEAALFVGHPENKALSASQIAATMRGVSAGEVEEIVEQLNQVYAQDGNAFRIHSRDGGFVFGLSEEMRSVRSAFYGKIRETRLNQASIDVLALVAYQPGITANVISEQRGKDSGPVVNQMVRRELLEVRREPNAEGKMVPTFYPTARLLNLLGLSTLDDLPHVDENDISSQEY